MLLLLINLRFTSAKSAKMKVINFHQGHTYGVRKIPPGEFLSGEFWSREFPTSQIPPGEFPPGEWMPQLFPKDTAFLQRYFNYM